MGVKSESVGPRFGPVTRWRPSGRLKPDASLVTSSWTYCRPGTFDFASSEPGFCMRSFRPKKRAPSARRGCRHQLRVDIPEKIRVHFLGPVDWFLECALLHHEFCQL